MSAKTVETTMNHIASKGEAHAHQGQISRAAQAGHFARHFFEMCVAMCVGIVALDPVYLWVASLIGYRDPYFQFPELSALVLAFNMTVPMVVWMRFRGMDWRSIAEMSAAMVIEAILIIGAYWLGIIANTNLDGVTSLWLLQHVLMMPAMLPPMLYRLDVYTGKKCH